MNYLVLHSRNPLTIHEGQTCPKRKVIFGLLWYLNRKYVNGSNMTNVNLIQMHLNEKMLNG